MSKHCWGVSIYNKARKRYKTVEFFSDIRVAREYVSYYKYDKTRITRYDRTK